jgi:hypothetical protein
VAHHLEFDAGVLAKEMLHAGFGDRRTEWLAIARAGLCTMDPDIGAWVRECTGLERSPERARNAMRLQALVAALGPYSANQSGTMPDACVHITVFRALQELARRS